MKEREQVSLTIKLIIAGILAAAVAYSYAWTFYKGQSVGQAKEYKIQMKLLEKNQLEFNELRAKELREARAIFEQELLNQKKKVKSLNEANKILKAVSKEQLDCLLQPAPLNLLSVLNNARSSINNTGPSELPGKPDAEVRASTPTP